MKIFDKFKALSRTSKACVIIIVLVVIFFSFKWYWISYYEKNYNLYTCSEDCSGRYESDDGDGCFTHVGCDSDLIRLLNSKDYRRESKKRKAGLIRVWAEDRWDSDVCRCVEVGLFFVLLYTIIVFIMDIRDY